MSNLYAKAIAINTLADCDAPVEELDRLARWSRDEDSLEGTDLYSTPVSGDMLARRKAGQTARTVASLNGWMEQPA